MANPITSNETVTKLLDTNANPAPLGLMGFALTTILLNIHNAGFYELNAMILAIGIFYGGIAQLIAGIMEWKKNNTFRHSGLHLVRRVLADAGRHLAHPRHLPEHEAGGEPQRD